MLYYSFLLLVVNSSILPSIHPSIPPSLQSHLNQFNTTFFSFQNIKGLPRSGTAQREKRPGNQSPTTLFSISIQGNFAVSHSQSFFLHTRSTTFLEKIPSRLSLPPVLGVAYAIHTATAIQETTVSPHSSQPLHPSYSPTLITTRRRIQGSGELTLRYLFPHHEFSHSRFALLPRIYLFANH